MYHIIGMHAYNYVVIATYSVQTIYCLVLTHEQHKVLLYCIKNIHNYIIATLTTFLITYNIRPLQVIS